MSADKVLISKVKPWRRYRSGYHVLGSFKEILVVRATRGTVRENERWLPTASCSTTALGIIGRRRWHVAHVDDVELGDINAKLHSGRAVENRQFTLPKIVFALYA